MLLITHKVSLLTGYMLYLAACVLHVTLLA